MLFMRMSEPERQRGTRPRLAGARARTNVTNPARIVPRPICRASNRTRPLHSLAAAMQIAPSRQAARPSMASAHSTTAKQIVQRRGLAGTFARLLVARVLRSPPRRTTPPRGRPAIRSTCALPRLPGRASSVRFRGSGLIELAETSCSSAPRNRPSVADLSWGLHVDELKGNLITGSHGLRNGNSGNSAAASS